MDDEEGELESGTQGIGGCVYYTNDVIPVQIVDYNFFGTVEAQGSDSFKFMPPEENDWNRDQIGFLDYESSMALYFSTNKYI